MRHYCDYFKNKKITLLGLGVLGRGVGDAAFLAGCGADLVVTDLKNETELASSLEALRGFSNIIFRLGEHTLDDFKNKDFILKGPNVSESSPYIKEARKNGIPIKMSASWFMEIAEIPLVGVTGTRGKSTVTALLYDAMKAAGMDVLLGGNVKGVSTLALLPEVKKNSIALMELDSWQLAGFGEANISPHVAIFTTFYPDHLNFYTSMDTYLEDKAHIFLHQKPEDTLIVSSQAVSTLKEKYGKKIVSRVVVANPLKFPKSWKLKMLGEHNKLNAMCAIEAARALGIGEETIQEVVENFTGISGRLEFIREVNGIKIYNDTTATTPDATIAALRALNPKPYTLNPKIILVMGGADKNLDMTELIKEIPKQCTALILLPGTGTENLRIKNEELRIMNVKSLEEAVLQGMKLTKKGDTLLFSPAFASFGMFKNEFDRGEQFNAIVKEL